MCDYGKIIAKCNIVTDNKANAVINFARSSMIIQKKALLIEFLLFKRRFLYLLITCYAAAIYLFLNMFSRIKVIYFESNLLYLRMNNLIYSSSQIWSTNSNKW